MATVLVVEDNPVNMKLAVLLLRKAGHSPLCAHDAESALIMVHSAAPELILMDCQLPGMDGPAATALLKQDPATARIPVIAISAASQPGDPPSRLGWGCDAYLAKPLHYPQLYAAIEHLLARPAAPVSSPPVDLTVLESLVGSDPGTISDFFAEFIVSSERTRLELRRACDERQALTASRVAHRLRSSALMVGAARLAALCMEIETTCGTGEADAGGALLPGFEAELDAVVRFLQSQALPSEAS